MKHLALMLVAVASLATGGCNSGLDAAKDEMTQACLSRAAGQLTDEECGCMTEKAFASLTGDERDFLARISSTDRNIDERDLADELGMDLREMRAKGRSIQRKIMSNAVRTGMECVG